MERFDLVVTGGTLVSSRGRQPADVATRAGRIAATGSRARARRCSAA
jgi:predicted amidohydrolase YtcJ